MKIRRFAELAEKITTDETRRGRVAAHKQVLLQELCLAELRRARQLSQADLARTLNTTQSGVSRLEHQADLYLSTLRKYVEALGGQLEVQAIFPDGRCSIISLASLTDDRVEAGPSADEPYSREGQELPASRAGTRAAQTEAAREWTGEEVGADVPAAVEEAQTDKRA